MKSDINATHQHILEAGYRLIANKGFSGVGLSEILKYAGVPKGSFYHYFKSKEQFGEELIKNYFRDYLVALDARFGERSNSAYERLISYWQGWLDTQSCTEIERKCLVVKLSAEVADMSEPMRLALLDGSSQVIDRIGCCIKDGFNDNSIPEMNARLTAQWLYNMWLGASLMSKLSRNADALNTSMQTTQAILTSKTVL